MQKPTWKIWLVGVLVWCGSYIAFGLLVHRTLSRDTIGAAIVSALVGVSLGCYLQLRRRRKSWVYTPIS